MKIPFDFQWGMLYPYQFGLPVVRLEQDTITVGRSNGCDTVITTNHCSQMFLDSISKIHFVIKKTPQDGIRLLDKSTNGTSVGDGEADKIIGKKNHVGVLLEHNKIISMSGYKSYVFMRTDPSFKNKDLYPKELRNRYIPSIQLGKGASGEVILGWGKINHFIRCNILYKYF